MGLQGGRSQSQTWRKNIERPQRLLLQQISRMLQALLLQALLLQDLLLKTLLLQALLLQALLLQALLLQALLLRKAGRVGPRKHEMQIEAWLRLYVQRRGQKGRGEQRTEGQR